MTTQQNVTRTHRVVMLLMAVAVLVPSLFGFGTKFIEFIALYRGDVEGAFAISPILNYLLASLGFLFLFGWAALGGMFRDIEAPKYTMLENESRLDEDQDDPDCTPFKLPIRESMTQGDWSPRQPTPRF
jgi:hypothetical protein